MAIANSNQLFSAEPRVMLVIVSSADLFFCIPYLQQWSAAYPVELLQLPSPDKIRTYKNRNPKQYIFLFL